MNEHSKTIVAFTQLQRSFHNHLLHFMIVFIITGLPLLSTSFSFLGSLFAIPYDFFGSVYTDLAASGLTDNERLSAGLQVARGIHRITALFFVIMAIPFVVVQLIHIRSWAIWPEDSWGPAAFFRGIKGLWDNYVSFKHVRIGKFNVGQKLFAWTMIAAIVAITASGFVLMFRDLFSQGTQEFSRFVHAASFVIIGVFLIVHLYLSLLPMNRQSLNAMFEDGRLPIDYVKSHHPIWHEKLTGEKRSKPASAEKAEQPVTDEKLTAP
jgi:formate dehydrogenase subunit gamma